MTLKTYIAACAALLAMASCSGNKSRSTDADTSLSDDYSTYIGTIPAADAAGLQMTLTLKYTTPSEGEYELTEKALTQDNDTFTSAGTFTVHSSTTSDVNQRYLKLTPGHTDRASDLESTSAAVRYFLVDNDSTLTLTDASLLPAESGLDYTLHLQAN